MRYRAVVAYDGGAYQGFQRQADGIPTIQASIESALVRIAGHMIGIVGAGRTDTGVHATGQVIAFDLDWRHDTDALLRAFNANLPDDIALQSVDVAESGFHPRFDARSRRYAYTVIQAEQRQPLLRGYSWYVPEYHRLNVQVMNEVAVSLNGTHDCATFGNPPQGDNTVRTVLHSEWSTLDEGFGRRLVYHVEANAFLHHMVRRMVGMLVDVGRGAMTTTEFHERFEAADLSQAGTMAPPQGLTLVGVRYVD